MQKLKCECNGLRLIRIDDFTTKPCICVRRDSIVGSLSRFGEVHFKHPQELMVYPDVTFIESSVYAFKDYLAGYLLVSGISFFVGSAQDYFDLRMTNEPHGQYFAPQLLVVYFSDIAPNKIMGQYIIQLAEERSITNKKTWIVSALSGKALSYKFREGQSDFESFLARIQNQKFLAPKTTSPSKGTKPHKPKTATDGGGSMIAELQKFGNVYNRSERGNM